MLDEQQLKQVIDTHNPPQATIRTWRNRGKIPAKYLIATAEDIQPCTDQQQQEAARLLLLHFLNVHKLNSITSIRAADISREKARMRAAEYTALVAECFELCEILRSIEQSKGLFEAEKSVQDSRLKWFVISTSRSTVGFLRRKSPADAASIKKFRADCRLARLQLTPKSFSQP